MTLHRCYLFVPASNARALEKARGLSVDGVIIDLEDAVAPQDKAAARDAAVTALAQGFTADTVLLRINAMDSADYADDMLAAATSRADGILLPKVDGPAHIQAAAAAADGKPLWAMVETPLAVLHIDEIAAASPQLQGFVMGLEDLAAALHAEVDGDRSQVRYALQRTVLAARAYGMTALDSPYIRYTDTDGLKAAAAQAKALGFDGKTAIHPSQTDVIADVFSPGERELKVARAIIEAWDQAAGSGVATHDGQLVESLHVERAKEIVLAAQEAGQRV